MRRRKARRGSARKSDWIQALSVCPVELPVVKCVDGVVPAAAMPTLFTLVDTFDMAFHTDHVSILRIVGDVTFFYQGGFISTNPDVVDMADGVVIGMGIYVTQEDESLNVVNLTAMSNPDAEASWMWRQQLAFAPSFFQASGGVGLTNDQPLLLEKTVRVEVPVHRVLRARDVLLLSIMVLGVNNFNVDHAPQVLVSNNLRVLTRTKG